MVTIRTVRLHRGRGRDPRCALQTLIPSAWLLALPVVAAAGVEAVDMAAGRRARGWGGGTVERREKMEQHWRRQQRVWVEKRRL